MWFLFSTKQPENSIFNQHLTRRKRCTVEVPETLNKNNSNLRVCFQNVFIFASKPSKRVSLRPKPHRMWTVCTAIDRKKETKFSLCRRSGDDHEQNK